MRCPICDHPAGTFGTAQVLGSYDAEFSRCAFCGYLFASDPVWLGEAYASAITVSDLGLVDRNLWFARLAGSVVRVLCNPDDRFLDYGGGTGLFTRLMRDKGFDWYWFDTACRNDFAAGYEAELHEGARYELVSAVELFEHLVDPVGTFERLSTLSSNVLFTTQLLPDPPPPLGQWWYYALEHGQHVSFYTRRSLELLGEKFGLKLSTNGENVHLFSKRKLPDLAFRVVTSSAFATLAAALPRRSLLPSDFEAARTATRNNDAHRP